MTFAALLAMVVLLAGGCANTDPAPPAPAPGNSAGTSVPTSTPATGPTDWHTTEPADPLPASQPARITIPALDIDQPTITLGLTGENTMQVPTDAAGIGWYQHSPTPGQPGPSVLAGHINWNGQQGVFHNLGTLTPGDQVHITRQDGRTAHFEVTRVEQYPKREFPTTRVYGNTPGPELRLITCSGQYDPQTRSYRDNTVAYAQMIDSKR